ncbi:NAD(P)-binding protein [Meredithblackwellia eburnea MCA 4105]
MKVLVFGASGYLGLPIAQSFVRAGHTVIGQTRSKSNAHKLASEEIVPLIAEPADPSTWHHIIPQVDCVVDCVGGMEIAKLCKIILDTVVAEASASRPHGPPLSFIYASGTWVHGDSINELHGSRSDSTPLQNPMPLTAWRLDHEQTLLGLKSPSFAPNVVRPALIYGKSGSLTAEWLAGAKAGEIVFHGRKEARLAMIHVDDCAALFVLVAENAFVTQGLIFDAANPYPEPILFILDQLALASGGASVKFSEPTSDYHKALQSSNLLRPRLAKTLLGWETKKAPFGEGMELYYKSYLASLN